MRVWEIAEQNKIMSWEVINLARLLGMNVKSASSQMPAMLPIEREAFDVMLTTQWLITDVVTPWEHDRSRNRVGEYTDRWVVEEQANKNFVTFAWLFEGEEAWAEANDFLVEKRHEELERRRSVSYAPLRTYVMQKVTSSR